MYCVSLMDRTNMSAANIAGMSVELDLAGFRYVSVSWTRRDQEINTLTQP